MALSSLPDTLFTSRSTMFGGAYIPREVLEQQALSKRPTGKLQQIFILYDVWLMELFAVAIMKQLNKYYILSVKVYSKTLQGYF